VERNARLGSRRLRGNNNVPSAWLWFLRPAVLLRHRDGWFQTPFLSRYTPFSGYQRRATRSQISGGFHRRLRGVPLAFRGLWPAGRVAREGGLRGPTERRRARRGAVNAKTHGDV
jgi:hypothetical protein